MPCPETPSRPAAPRAPRRPPRRRSPTLIDVAALAEHLGVEVRHVRRLVHERRIPFIKWGHLVRFDPDEVSAWLEANRIEPLPASARGDPLRHRPGEDGVDPLVGDRLVAVESADVGRHERLHAVAQPAMPPRRAERRPAARWSLRRGGSRRCEAGSRPTDRCARCQARSPVRARRPLPVPGPEQQVVRPRSRGRRPTRGGSRRAAAGSAPSADRSSGHPGRRSRCRPP